MGVGRRGSMKSYIALILALAVLTAQAQPSKKQPRSCINCFGDLTTAIADCTAEHPDLLKCITDSLGAGSDCLECVCEVLDLIGGYEGICHCPHTLRMLYRIGGY